MVDAVVLAGSSNDGPLRECSEVRYEALIPIGEKIMVQYVVEALLGCRQVRRVLVVGPVAALSPFLTGERVSVIESRGGIMENIEAGLVNSLDTDRVLLVTSDIPMLTSQAVNDFLELCGDLSGDLYYPIISKPDVESKFPTTRRTYVNFKEGVFTGGNLFLINPVVYKKCVENGQKIINLRKSPFRLCRLIGLGFVLKFLMRSLTIADAERKVSALLGRIKGIVVMSKFPEVGVDVDKPADLALALRILGA
jgi:GTP:adenosylcobinamide-phosphate guanylyltransferase